MATEAGDAEMLAEIGRDAEALLATYELERTALLFSGEYDGGGAIISISAGAGGTEATDWAEMLLRMYLRWAERHRFRTEIVDQTEGEQTGLKSVTVEIGGRRVYGWLRAATDGDREHWRTVLDRMIAGEIENSRALMDLVDCGIEFMATTDLGESPLIHGRNLRDLLARRIALMERHAKDDPFIDPDYMERMAGRVLDPDAGIR